MHNSSKYSRTCTGSGELKRTAKANKGGICSKYTRKKNLRTQELPGYIFFPNNYFERNYPEMMQLRSFVFDKSLYKVMESGPEIGSP